MDSISNPRIIFLTGAPRFDPTQKLSSSKALEPAFTRLLSKRTKYTRQKESRSSTPSSALRSCAAWRVIANKTKQSQFPAGLDPAPQISFLSFSADDEQPDLEGNFLDHSFSIYADGDRAPPTHDISSTPTSISASFYSWNTSFGSNLDRAHRTVYLPFQIPSLRSLPGASHLLSIAPQTVTVDIVVGVISVAPARTVTVRRTKREMEIVELLVGDESKAGFSITFWLVPVRDPKAPVEGARRKLERLRAGDVVLIRNVALSSFRGVVHGQSLNARVCKNETVVERLGARGVLDVEVDGLEQSLAKARRVFSWVRAFFKIGDTGNANGKKRKRDLDDGFPPESQDSE